MRMKYMYYLLKKNYSIIEKANTQPAKDHYRINNWNAVINSLNEIATIPIFSEDVKNIFSLKIGMMEPKEYEAISIHANDKYLILYQQILNKMLPIIEFCENAGFSETEKGFDIKMPPTKDFSEFVDYIKEIEFVLNQCPYLKVEGEKIEFIKVDSGSVWMEFLVVATGSTVLLANLAKIVDKCVKIKSHILSTKQQEEQLRTLGLKNDMLEPIINAFKEATNLLTKKCVEELEEEIHKTADPEEEDRVKRSLERLVDLMQQGMEIYPSIDAPNEIKDLFPTSDELISLPEKSIALISDSKDEQ